MTDTINDIDHAAVDRAVSPFIAAISDDLMPLAPLNALASWWLSLNDIERWSFANRMLNVATPKCSGLTVCAAVVKLDDAMRERLSSHDSE
jgi:hypothetical protein